MKSITRQKPFEEVKNLLEGLERVFVVGCGTCTTMTKTGGIDQVAEMKGRLQGAGKTVTGQAVIAVACDEMSETFLKENDRAVRSADSILVMACALGAQRIGSYLKKPVIPGVDTLFIGLEETPGCFHEVCAQCGQCIIGETAGVCPITACHKSLVNGPCGGTNNGKCEVDREKDCAWTLIYQRLKEQGRLELMHRYHPPRNWQASLRPRVMRVS